MAFTTGTTSTGSTTITTSGTAWPTAKTILTANPMDYESLSGMTEFNINIVKALNGWIVRTYDRTAPGNRFIEWMVVTNEEDLAGIIAAAIIGDKLKGTAMPSEGSRLMGKDDLFKIPPLPLSTQWDTTVLNTHADTYRLWKDMIAGEVLTQP